MGIWTDILTMLFPLIPILVTSYAQYTNDLLPSNQFLPSLKFIVFNCSSNYEVVMGSFFEFFNVSLIFLFTMWHTRSWSWHQNIVTLPFPCKVGSCENGCHFGFVFMFFFISQYLEQFLVIISVRKHSYIDSDISRILQGVFL